MDHLLRCWEEWAMPGLHDCGAGHTASVIVDFSDVAELARAEDQPEPASDALRRRALQLPAGAGESCRASAYGAVTFHPSNSAASVKARSPRRGGCWPLAYLRPRLSEYQPASPAMGA